ncbi:MAG: transcription/translation regulatory transformer protein RfaH [Gallionellales bacterium 35-53-114]|jgi:transcriptional antiterminator RfaH|nr:MAG: transcription/translation regulatory transformer protein RfaH [Gallionellales bacterium 35-53-114]OYZ63470.1 MAG: transcription/translation regulatory transformer protein RfaH [Gallionellales bacterium 24-53-125]OZB10917.1 MAG: transcription/translation regulatory transformer protein RfaH [Gallionellales bacterium 39-52-133]HQS58901.1 transcription/translation regulatory transformer protein RfaH [Gallionellaceae bacterium]HQS75714.1 transcription/translation regulatory transformer prote
MYWCVVQTKPRQEKRALLNLEKQGYECYLPLLAVEKLHKGMLKVEEEPLFARYMFIRLGMGQSGKSWGPIRSTKGVSHLVTFGTEYAKVDEQLIEALRSRRDALRSQPQRLFAKGERVWVADGPFAGIEAIYQMSDSESRAMVLIEILSKPVQVKIPLAKLNKII